MAAYMAPETYNTKFAELVEKAMSGNTKEIKRGFNNDIEKYILMSESLDKESGRIQSLAGAIPFVINIPLGFFIVEELFVGGDKARLTSKEITAVLLHEIGHAMTFIEYMSNIQYTGYFGNYDISEMHEEIKQYPEKSRTNIQKMIDEIKKSKEYKEHVVFKKLTDLTETIITKDDLFLKIRSEDNYANNVWLMVFFAVLRLMILIKIIKSKLTLLVFLSEILAMSLGTKLGSDLLEKFNRNSGHITSREFFIAAKNESIYERLADEYVGRFGLSEELNSSLMKIYTFYKTAQIKGAMFPFYSKEYRESFFINVLLVALNGPFGFLGIMVGSCMTLGIPYESIDVRLSRNIQNIKVSFQKEDMPPDVKKLMIHQYDVAQKKYTEYTKSDYVEKLGRIYSFLMGIPVTVLLSPMFLMNGNLPKQYQRVLEDIDSLLGNDSFVYAAKVSAIFED